MILEMTENKATQNNANGLANLKIIGVGGAGCNAIRTLIKRGVRDVGCFIAVNTDNQDLDELRQESAEADVSNIHIITIGNEITKGSGTGMSIDNGKKAVLEEKEKIIELIKDADMIFMATGLGGGTGTGATPAIAEMAKDLGIMTIGFVYTPRKSELERRTRLAAEGLTVLHDVIDAYLPIPNELLQPKKEASGGKNLFSVMYKEADEVLLYALGSVIDIIQKKGYINVDLSDVKAVFKGGGLSLISVGSSSKGENRAVDAINQAINKPLLGQLHLDKSKGVIANIVVNEETFSMEEYDAIGNFIRSIANSEALVKIGVTFAEDMGEELKVSIMVTGLTLKKEGSESPNSIKPQLIDKKAKIAVNASNSSRQDRELLRVDGWINERESWSKQQAS